VENIVKISLYVKMAPSNHKLRPESYFNNCDSYTLSSAETQNSY